MVIPRPQTRRLLPVRPSLWQATPPPVTQRVRRRRPEWAGIPLLSMVAACGLSYPIWCQAHLEEPASLGTYSPANDGVTHLPQLGHLMGDTSQMI